MYICTYFRWYRACVMDVREGEEKVLMEYLCFFVDYGDLEWVCGNDVEPISPQLLEVIIKYYHYGNIVMLTCIEYYI